MKWTPPMNGRLEQQLQAVISDLLGLYARAEEQLVTDVAKALSAGEALSGDVRDLDAALVRMRQSARRTVNELKRLTPALVERLVAEAGEHGLAYALAQFEALPVPFEITADTPSAQAVVSLQADLSNRLAAVDERILRLPQDVYRSVIAETTSVSLLLGRTSRVGQKAAWQKLLSSGVTGFVDSAGREWNLASYVEMATRTAAMRAYRQQGEDTMLANGVQLASIVTGNDSCKLCGPWSGRVLAITGGTGMRSVLNPITGKPELVAVEYTLDMAREDGWGHPSCRCTTVAYMPGLSVVVNSQQYHPELEAERDQLRAMERRVRSIKRDVITASSDEDKTYHRRRLRQAQARIRQHVDSTGLNRKRYREQLDLGHKR